MKLIKLYIYKLKPNYLDLNKFKMSDIYDLKTVGLFGYFKHKRKGWKLSTTEYFIFTRFVNQLSKLTINNIIAIASISVVFIIFLLNKFYFKD